MNRLFCFINIWSTLQIIRVYTPDEVQLRYIVLILSVTSVVWKQLYLS